MNNTAMTRAMTEFGPGMDAHEAVRLASFLASKLCHDLVGPLAALHNGVEFIQDGDARVRDEAIPLIGMSAREALARLAFFRLALGAMGNGEGDAALKDARKAAMEYFTDGRVSLHWPEPSGLQWPKTQVKLLLNLLYMAKTVLPRGGQVRIALLASPGVARIEAIGDNALLPAPTRAALLGDFVEAPLGTENCMAHYARLLARAADLRIETAQMGGQQVNFQISRA